MSKSVLYALIVSKSVLYALYGVKRCLNQTVLYIQIVAIFNPGVTASDFFGTRFRPRSSLAEEGEEAVDC